MKGLTDMTSILFSSYGGFSRHFDVLLIFFVFFVGLANFLLFLLGLKVLKDVLIVFFFLHFLLVGFRSSWLLWWWRRRRWPRTAKINVFLANSVVLHSQSSLIILLEIFEVTGF